jgi:hypothetical protein
MNPQKALRQQITGQTIWFSLLFPVLFSALNGQKYGNESVHDIQKMLIIDTILGIIVGNSFKFSTFATHF